MEHLHQTQRRRGRRGEKGDGGRDGGSVEPMYCYRTCLHFQSMAQAKTCSSVTHTVRMYVCAYLIFHILVPLVCRGQLHQADGAVVRRRGKGAHGGDPPATHVCSMRDDCNSTIVFTPPILTPTSYFSTPPLPTNPHPTDPYLTGQPLQKHLWLSSKSCAVHHTRPHRSL